MLATKHPTPARRPKVGDRHGHALTTSAEAAALYREAIDGSLGGEAGVPELLDRAIACDATFAVAHAARWTEAHNAGDARAAHIAREAALASLEGLTAWEREHVECMAVLLQREPGAWVKAREHLDRHPRDLAIVSLFIGDLFFHAGEGKGEAVMEVLQAIAPHQGDDWAFAARLGFHMSELGNARGNVHRAISIIDGALQARPHAPFVAHAMAHALLESGDRALSYRFLLDWASRHECAGPLDGHIQWHLSLGELEIGNPKAAVARYVQASAPGVSHCALGLKLADAAGLFCKMALDEVPLDGMPHAELHALLGRLGGASKIPFVAVHVAALALALANEDAIRRFRAAVPPDGSAKSEALALVMTAFAAYVAGDARACAAALERDRPRGWDGIGGSNEERALIAKLYARARGQT